MCERSSFDYFKDTFKPYNGDFPDIKLAASDFNIIKEEIGDMHASPENARKIIKAFRDEIPLILRS